MFLRKRYEILIVYTIFRFYRNKACANVSSLGFSVFWIRLSGSLISEMRLHDPIFDLFRWNHSARIATRGSTFVARRAGT